METKINFEAKKVILIVFGILLISFVYGFDMGDIPPLPDHFIGNVTIDGQNAAIGTQISIYVDSALESVYSVSEVGKYDLFVTTGSAGTSPSVIEFKIKDILAGTSTRGWGNTTYLDLSITTIPTSSDSSSSSSSGGGGGGGGGIISLPSTTGTSESESSGSEENTIETWESEEQIGRKQTGITGAVIGFLESGKGIVAVIIVIVLGIGVILIKFKAPKWKRKSS